MASTRCVAEDRVGPAAPLIVRLAEVLGRVYDVDLEVPKEVNEAAPVKGVKSFCVGALENPVSHTWWRALSRMSANDRMSVSASLFLARKVLPSPPDTQQAARHAKLMSTPAPAVPPGYLRFVDREVDRLFPVGWDHRYASHVSGATITPSACIGSSRRQGGARSAVIDHVDDWYKAVVYGRGLPDVHRVRYAVVRCDGKQRGVTVADRFHHALGPLHRTLYDHLSGFEWLLRGEARAKEFDGFSKEPGELFVSGDYESATDNLNLDVAERILSRILFRARSCPRGLRDYAVRTLRAQISYPGGEVVTQSRGQLMGNYLSFPLLCLQNYLAFKFLIPRPVPVRINGDDIVFRCRPDEWRRWAEGVGSLGLTLSAGKTMVHASFFSLNSAFFRARGRRPREIPVVRLTTVSRKGPPSAAAFVKFIRGWKGHARRILGGWYLQSYGGIIRASGRSVVGGWRIPADNSQLHTAGLSVREAFYRGSGRASLALDESIPPAEPSLMSYPATSTEWVLHRGYIAATDFEIHQWRDQRREELWEASWQKASQTPAQVLETWWDDVKRTGFESAWHAWKLSRKRVARMGVVVNIPLRQVRVPSRRGVWVPRCELPARIARRGGLGLR